MRHCACRPSHLEPSTFNKLHYITFKDMSDRGVVGLHQAHSKHTHITSLYFVLCVVACGCLRLPCALPPIILTTTYICTHVCALLIFHKSVYIRKRLFYISACAVIAVHYSNASILVSTRMSHFSINSIISSSSVSLTFDIKRASERVKPRVI